VKANQCLNVNSCGNLVTLAATSRYNPNNR
jgi:hypothetical protein